MALEDWRLVVDLWFDMMFTRSGKSILIEKQNRNDAPAGMDPTAETPISADNLNDMIVQRWGGYWICVS